VWFVTIRRATSVDEAIMRAFWDAFTVETAFTPYPGSAFTPELLTDFVALVAENGDGVVGCVYANVAQDHFGFVFGLFVRREHRHQGIARALMRAIATEIRDSGRQYVVLNVDTPNTAARLLYERLGFVDAARTLRIDVDGLLA
jgi:ribosomal protein S18 acetylase RimI-like enzyme